MDALSSPASTLRPRGGTSALLTTSPREPPFRVQPPTATTAAAAHLTQYPHFPNKPKRSSLSLPPPSQSFTATPHHRLSHSSSRASPRPTSATTTTAAPTAATTTHTRAATGYAAALLDVARCHNAVEALERDARRLARAVGPALGSPFGGDAEKGEAVRRAVERGGFGKQLAVLMRMLVGKGKVGLVAEVLAELGRLFDELSGTSVVVVSSDERIAEEELRGIADKVRRMSGAVNVKVRHLFRPSFSSPSLRPAVQPE